MYVMLAAAFSGSLALFHRFVIKDFDFISYGFLQQGIATIVYFFIMISAFQFTFNFVALQILILAMFIWGITTIINFKTFQKTEASIRTPVYTTRVIFVAFLSFFVLSEPFPLSKIIGTILIFVGIFMLNLRKRIFSLKDFGIQLIILTAFLVSVATTVDKIALGFFSPVVYGFFIFLADTIAFGFIASKRIVHLKGLLKSKMKIIVVAGFIDAIAYLGILSALKLQQASISFPLIILGSGMTAVIGGIIILKERQNILQKIFGSLIAILGALLVAGYFVI